MSPQAHLVSPKDLPALLAEGEGATLIDVRSADDYERNHLPDSVNNCVYEVDFIERMPALVPELSRMVCVYGHAADTYEARMAAEKLTRAGYAKVLELREGIAGWKEAGLPLEGSCKAPTPPPELHGTREVDLAQSRVEWTGRNLLNRHHGTLGLKSGSLEFEHGSLTGGNFTLDVNAIACETLRGDPLHDVLVSHLRSDDFFDTALYPEASFQLTSATPIAEATPGAPNLRLTGELTLKGRTQPLTFEAVTGITPEGQAAAQALLSIDRTQWNVLYGSGKFFRNLGMHLVNDLIELQLRIVTR